jgi:hypothetical protein
MQGAGTRTAFVAHLARGGEVQAGPPIVLGTP